MKHLAILFSVTLLLAACGGGEKETVVVNPATPAAPTNAQASQSCPAGTLKASDGSCTRECTASEARNAAGVCVTLAPAPDFWEYGIESCDFTGVVTVEGLSEYSCKTCDYLNSVEQYCYDPYIAYY